MPAPTIVTTQQLVRRIGLPDAPTIIDVRTPEDAAADPRFLPGALRRSHRDVADWAGGFAGRDVTVVCQKGLKLSQGAAARRNRSKAASRPGATPACRWSHPPMCRCAMVPGARCGSPARGRRWTVSPAPG